MCLQSIILQNIIRFQTQLRRQYQNEFSLVGFLLKLPFGHGS
jgi:hypothetical protein